MRKARTERPVLRLTELGGPGSKNDGDWSNLIKTEAQNSDSTIALKSQALLIEEDCRIKALRREPRLESSAILRR